MHKNHTQPTDTCQPVNTEGTLWEIFDSTTPVESDNSTGDVLDLFGGVAIDRPAAKKQRKQWVNRPRVKTLHDFIGQKFNMITVTGVAQNGKGVSQKLYGRCDCGTERSFGGTKLVRGSTVSCGCVSQTHIAEGTRFGLWIVGEKVETHSGGKNRFYFKCKCDCGTEAVRDSRTLRNGSSTSCGCDCIAQRMLPDNGTAFKSVLYSYQRNAVKRGYTFELSDVEARDIMSHNCVYCGEPPSNTAWPKKTQGGAYVYNGLDRQNNSLGYSKTNTVSSCFFCNRMKLYMSVSDFLSWASRASVAGTYKAIHNTTLTGTQINRIFATYKRGAKDRSLSFDLNLSQTKKYVETTCYYCGVPPSNTGCTKGGVSYKYGGIDRVCNADGYSKLNCRSSCWTCNWAKSDLTETDFLSHVRKIAAHQANLASTI